MAQLTVWFDMPVADLKRAAAFYSRVLDTEVHEAYPGVMVIQDQQGQPAGCLFESGQAVPAGAGLLLYFGVDGRLDEAVAKVREFGGRILKPVHAIAPYGRRAIVLDSEGNRLALHSQ